MTNKNLEDVFTITVANALAGGKVVNAGIYYIF